MDIIESRLFDRETLTRRDVARRQLSTAITFVLGNGDAVSANVLTWAATEVLRGVADHRGVQTFNATIEDRIKPEYLKDWRYILKDHYNFSKHADRDPERVVEDFAPEATTWILFGACHDYKAIYAKQTWAMIVYQIWFLCRHPEITVDEGKDMVVKLEPGLGYPAGKPLRASVQYALEMIENGRKFPHLLNELGSRWLDTIEPE